MSEINLSDPSFSPENENPQQRRRGRPPLLRQAPEERSMKRVRICCISDTHPWVEEMDEDNNLQPLRFLNAGETVFVPEWQADILVSNKHAARV